MSEYEIWLSEPFKKIGNCFRRKSEFNVSPETLRVLEQARKNDFHEHDEFLEKLSNATNM